MRQPAHPSYRLLAIRRVDRATCGVASSTPRTGHRLLDRTLVYTAFTRVQRQVVPVGAEAAAKEAVERPPRAQAPQVEINPRLARRPRRTLPAHNMHLVARYYGHYPS
ncbi:hypothetical protein C6P64_13045 [Malikia granosa]|uniref:UvrD-like helicase C-terminal domain-containing protein n=1 Tax=Malikia granosa TaxID=263067 RepID=A0A2S9K2M2_9BURK|nr:hypothetical protein C6P64_13045 [Malikia granosa]